MSDQQQHAASPGGGFSEGFVEADGFRVRYCEAGQGAPLVHLHGAGGLRLNRAHDLLHDKRLPRSGRCGVREVQHRSLFDQEPEEGESAQALINLFAEFGIERDGSLQQE